MFTHTSVCIFNISTPYYVIKNVLEERFSELCINPIETNLLIDWLINEYIIQTFHVKVIPHKQASLLIGVFDQMKETLNANLLEVLTPIHNHNLQNQYVKTINDGYNLFIVRFPIAKEK